MKTTEPSTSKLPDMRENYEKLANKQQYIDIFIKFFGEENREKIETLINKAIIVLVPHKIEVYRFGQFITNNYPELSTENTDLLINYFSKVPSYIKDKRWELLCFEPILTTLGLKREDLIYYNNITNKYEWKPLALGKKQKLSKFLKEIVTSINLDEIEDMKQTEKENNENKMKSNAYVRQFKLDCEKNGIEINPDYSSDNWIKEILENKLPEPEADFYVKNQFKSVFNSTFCTNISSWEQMIEDNKYKTIILPLISKYNSKFKTLEHESKATQQATAELSQILASEIQDEKQQETLFAELKKYLKDHENTEAFMQEDLANGTPGIVLPLSNNLNVDTIIHEFLHLISINLKNKEVFVYHSSSTKMNNGKALTEFVTEYITRKLVEEFKNKNIKDLENFPIPVAGSTNFTDSAYNRGIELFKPFLDAYYEDLKECFITTENTFDLLTNKVGYNNFWNLIDLTSNYLDCNEYLYLDKLSEKIGIQLNSAQDVLEYQDKLQDIELTKLERKYVNTVIESTKLCEKLVEHKKEAQTNKNSTLENESNITI